MGKLITVSSCLLFCLLSYSAVQGATLYAKVAASGTGDCSSWANAGTLGQAIINCSAGDDIWVQSGTYGPISLENGVKIIGGFAGTETSASQSAPATNVTVIDGALSQAVSSANHAGSTVLRGFTIKNGHDNTFDGGGGLLLKNSSTQIVQCVFESNTAAWWGGAVAIRGSGSPEFVNCVFHDNGKTGGVETLAGAALYLDGGSPTFTNCLFYDNKSGDGAVIAIRSGTPTFLNCTLANNEATIGQGGAIHDEQGRAIIRNSILWGNTAARGADQILNLSGSQTTVTYSDVQGGWSGSGNLNVDPLFQDPSADDYKLQVGSPCKGNGLNSYLPLDVADIDWDTNTSEQLPKDLRMLKRLRGCDVDMGAYEATTAPCDGGNPPGGGGEE